MSEQFSRRQVELILRRTAELERRGDEALDAIGADDLEKVAAELGLSQEALRQALAEARAGMLAPEEAHSLLDRLLGGRLIEARRFVPGEADAVRATVERFMEEQGFQIRRQRQEITVWEPAQGMASWLRRAFGGRTAFRLPREVDVEIRIAAVPGGPHPVLVQLRIDARRLRSARAGGAALALVLGAGMAVLGAQLLPMPVELVAWGAGTTAGVAGAWGGRRSYLATRERLQVALERFLDFLEAAPSRPASAPAADPISRLVDFLSRDWWR